MFTLKYELEKDPPPIVSWDDYARHSGQELYELLNGHSEDEKVFQKFFERNPSYIPGAFELIGTSGHYPHAQTLIAQPEVDGGLFKRAPDFMWLAQDSCFFTPVLIEIERPGKKLFTSKDDQTAEFSQALNQIAEWKALLSVPENILMFYQCYDIPDKLRKKTFKPQYGLIYGRRSEFEGNIIRQRKRAFLTDQDVVLMSYDRLKPDPSAADMLCSKVSHGEYHVLTIPPTYRYSPATAENLLLCSDFEKAILNMEQTTDERKDFLIKRFPYWISYAKLEQRGAFCTSDYE